MTEILQLATVVLAVLGIFMVTVLVIRRLILAYGERRRSRLEESLRGVALDIIDGEVDPQARFSRRESASLAFIVARYSRRLTGDARANVAEFFEAQGGIDREIHNLTAYRTWRRAAAAFALGDMGSPRAIPALISALDDRHREVRSAAARSLGLLAATDAVPHVIDCLVSRRVPRGVAAFALVTIGSAARDQLRALLVHGDAAVRSAAAELLGFVGSPADAPLLISLLEDPAAVVRSAAAGALGRVGSDTAAEALREALDDPEAGVRTAAARSLGALDDVDATEPLVRQARDDLFEPAEAAARSLALIDPREAVEQGRQRRAGPHLIHAASIAEFER